MQQIYKTTLKKHTNPQSFIKQNIKQKSKIILLKASLINPLQGKWKENKHFSNISGYLNLYLEHNEAQNQLYFCWRKRVLSVSDASLKLVTSLFLSSYKKISVCTKVSTKDLEKSLCATVFKQAYSLCFADVMPFKTAGTI